jgi:hypothetical protein
MGFHSTYVVEDWQWIPLLLSLQQVIDKPTFGNLNHILVDAMVSLVI